ncbi:hypothetical protein [Streptomyces sp. NPDC058463]|uniref:hypothetical protein n=1 Tax=Streptomyces sp. NPDC058463 TaxID=3346510 RepID=UPI003646C4E2
MINELDSIDWSSMSHAYGPAGDVPVWLREMAAADPSVRDKALGHFYSAAHHQGDVHACTTASLPFLFALADDPAAPDRASIVELLLSIGRESVDRDDDRRVAAQHRTRIRRPRRRRHPLLTGRHHLDGLHGQRGGDA